MKDLKSSSQLTQSSRPSLRQIFGSENLSKAAIVLVVVLLAYFVPNKFLVFTPHSVPLTFVDQWTALMPAWIWVYVSYYLFLVGAFIFATGHQEQRVFVGAMIVTALIGCGVFFFFPTIVVRELYPWLGRSNIHTRVLDFIREADRPINCLPSMHVCMSYIAAATYSITTRRLWIRILAWIWFLAICFSTLATKQHYFVDVIAGFFLGVTVFAVMTNRYLARASSP